MIMTNSFHIEKMRQNAESIFHAGVRAVEPYSAVLRFCRREENILQIGNRSYDVTNFENIYVLGGGKAGAAMAGALEALIGDRITKGLVTVKYGHLAPTKKVVLLEAGHPIPDLQGQQSASATMDLARKAGENDLVICLISGGASALLSLPAEGLSLAEKQETIKVLLACGATIHEINTIRKHISMIKGGRLAQAAFPATVVTLLLSDVVGDDPAVIGSGPTIPDGSTFAECMEILSKYDLSGRLPGKVVQFLGSGASGNNPETPKSDSPVFENNFHLIVGSNMGAILAAREAAMALGYTPVILSSMIEGETRHVAAVHVAIAKEVRRSGHPAAPPACILSGGETTVTISGQGKGGRNQEFGLAAAIHLAGEQGMVVLSAGTDGTDGPTDAAGAIVDPHTIIRAAEAGMDPGLYLRNNDAYPFLERTGDLFKTGPTNTNVMDLRIMLIV